MSFIALALYAAGSIMWGEILKKIVTRCWTNFSYPALLLLHQCYKHSRHSFERKLMVLANCFILNTSAQRSQLTSFVCFKLVLFISFIAIFTRLKFSIIINTALRLQRANFYPDEINITPMSVRFGIQRIKRSMRIAISSINLIVI